MAHLDINNMLLSTDAEMRALGRMYLERIPSREVDRMDKIVMLLNSNYLPHIDLGLIYFSRYERSVKVFKDLLIRMDKMGYSKHAFNAAMSIQYNYARTAKLTSFFNEVNLVGEILSQDKAKYISQTLDKQ